MAGDAVGLDGAAVAAARGRRVARLLAPSRARLLLASCVLAAAAAGFAAAGPGSAYDAAAARADEAAEAVRADHAGLRRRVRALAAPPQAAPVDPDPTRFVQAAYEAAARSGVRLVRLAPRQREDAMDLQLLAPYGGLLRFAAELELLGASLRLLQIQGGPGAGAGAADGQGQLAVSVVAVLPRHAGVAGPHGEAARQAASAPGLRDPFSPVAAPGGVRDLSAEYKLSGVTAGGASPLATINGLDYEPGEQLDGMRVVRIADDAVHLARGEERFVIRLPSLPAAAGPSSPGGGPGATPRGARPSRP